MFIKLVLLFTLIPIVELYILIQLGSLYGAFTTILIVIGTGILGAALARREGFAVWRSIQTELQAGRFPADEMLDGLLLLVAGAVLLTPGLLTDITGFLILIPVTRSIIRDWVKKKLKGMMQTGNVGWRGFMD